MTDKTTNMDILVTLGKIRNDKKITCQVLVFKQLIINDYII